MSDDASQHDDAIANLLTLVITTSPTPSAPSTELLAQVLSSFHAHCPPLLRCHVIVVFDAYEQVTAQLRLKKGYVTADTAGKYNDYKHAVKHLVFDNFLPCSGGGGGSSSSSSARRSLVETSAEAEYGSPCSSSTTPVPLTIASTEDGRVRFIEAPQGRRLGFGLAVRSALRAATTPYVWVHQHDWRLVHDIPLAALLRVMQASSDTQDESRPPIKYVCLPSGQRRSPYAASEQVMPYPALRKLAGALTGDYTATGRRQEQESSAATASSSGVVPLTPMFFWHDKPHVASTAHYLERVFPSRLAMMRGAFIEDTIGQAARNQMKDGRWARWATWLYSPGDGTTACLRHLRGRTWRGEEEERRHQSIAVEKGMDKARSRRGGVAFLGEVG